MQSLDMLAINEEPRNREQLIETMWKAFNYFPKGVWKGVNYLGNINIKHDLKIKSREEVHGAFIFPHLVTKIREMKGMFEIHDLLLGVTHDPVIVTYHRFELNRFKRIVNLIHDYVSNDIGMISLFETDEKTTTRIAAHGLGHNQGLSHHLEPIDLMYVRLLNGHSTEIDGFCDECQRKLKKRMELREGERQ
jgi:hypothetical protein